MGVKVNEQNMGSQRQKPLRDHAAHGDCETPHSPPYAKAQCQSSERGPTAAPPLVTGPQDLSSQAGRWGSPCTGFWLPHQELHEEGPGPLDGSAITCSRAGHTAVAHATSPPGSRPSGPRRGQPREVKLKVHLPVTLLIAEIVSYFVHDGSSGKDVGFVFLLGVVLDQHYQPVGGAVRSQSVLPLGEVVLYRRFVHFRILKRKTAL